MIIDYIPFAELDQARQEDRQQGKRPQEVDRYFSEKYRLADDLVIRRSQAFAEHANKRLKGELTVRSRIWQECLEDGITVAEARKRIANGNYNNSSEEGDIIIAAYRGAIRLQVE